MASINRNESLILTFFLRCEGTSYLHYYFSNHRKIFENTIFLDFSNKDAYLTWSAVKTEFGKFGDVLKKAQEKINKASEDIDENCPTITTMWF